MKFHIYTSNGAKFVRNMVDATQQQMADIIGTTKQTISNYENGRCKCLGTTAIAIGVVLDQLIEESDMPNSLKENIFEAEKIVTTKEIVL